MENRKAELKSCVVSVRVTSEEKELLEAISARGRTTVTDVMREALRATISPDAPDRERA
ncbi:ribbon-helix-helix protein, CopG family [Geomonas azotofigens]|uniref:ribbon-helix-helix protein, CopG family n=1 Tax=Geomonas azotofigens TaxID=2843196 RepID=UPI001C121846|nr:ribbon-helix-helix protein, CopG family [Geomonas azotofigens]MBU5613822.1 ribbon-helix-helix protein, CopG family [Geomonas azotofigens]